MSCASQPGALTVRGILPLPRQLRLLGSLRRLPLALAAAIASMGAGLPVSAADIDGLPGPDDVFADGFDRFGPVLKAWIHNGGSVLQCRGEWPEPLSVARDGVPYADVPQISCPSVIRLDGDFTPSVWQATDSGSGRSIQTATELPAPLALRLETVAYILGEDWLQQAPSPSLELMSGSGSQTKGLGKAGFYYFRIEQNPLAPVLGARWRLFSNDRQFFSAPVPVAPAPLRSTGINPGALVIGDVLATGQDELVGLSYARMGVSNPYAALGLGDMFVDRVFRDLRVADFDGDGIDDYASNVYDGGCTLVALNRGDHLQYSTPVREDGSCIAGSGETMLVADFDEDGDNDLFIPFYQRFDLLLNDGSGHFVDVAQDRGVDFPNYLPKPEGATAVDLNKDGHVDIVVVSEILLNDGRAQFTPAPTPYPLGRMFDEGLFIGDLDGDGNFDMVKHLPDKGPYVFWGLDVPATFSAPQGLFEDFTNLRASYGMSAGDLTGNGLMDIVFAGGAAPSLPGAVNPPPFVCIHYRPRQFECVENGWNGPQGFNDLQLIADIDGDQRNELLTRINTSPLLVSPTSFRPHRFTFGFDLRDSAGLRREHGRTLSVRCAGDGEPIATRHVEGGNGFLAQANYTVTVGSDHCDQVDLELYASAGTESLGTFAPGVHVVNTFAVS